MIKFINEVFFPFSLKPLVKCASTSDQIVHESLSKTTSEPPRFSRQNSTPNSQNQFPVNNDTNKTE
jgi:hypothetical protein